MASLRELRAFARSPLVRREARATRSLPHLLGLYLLAGGLDIVAILALARLLSSNGPGHGGAPKWVGTATSLACTILVFLPQLAAIGFASTAIVGDRIEDTLEALVMTPLDRREIVWAKLLGRTVPLRRFMLVAAPAYVACSALGVLLLFDASNAGLGTLPDSLFACYTILMLAGLAWAVLFIQAHYAAMVALYFSARVRRPWAAAMTAYALVLVPQVPLLCCFGLGIILPFLMGSVCFDRLVSRFDSYALGEPTHGQEPPAHAPYPLSLLRRLLR
jgi:ABC-type transport system involved in multi-copper enzyme maturation permease subunit